MKRGEAVRKYNYFDDEPEVLEPKKSIIRNIDFSSVADGIRLWFSRLASGELLDELKALREMPNLKRAAIKLFAFVIFIVFVILFIIIFTWNINSQNNKSELFYADAGKVCTDYMVEYGPIKAEAMDEDTYGEDMVRLTGLCYARQMDFDNDGSAELMLVYSNKNVYTLEVWSYVKKEFTKVYSQEANATRDAVDGSWIGLYHKGNKYYICKSEKTEPEKVTLYALKGNTFKKDSSCDYDYKNNIYSVDGKINAQDFETIKFSVIKSTRAESIMDIVTANIDGLSTVSVANLESQKTPQELKNDAYYEIVEKRNKTYGQAKVETENGSTYIDGIALVRLIDFNADGNEELFIVYRKMVKKSATNYYSGQNIMIEEPTYCMEVYDWNGTVAKKIFSRDSVSNLMRNNDTNYVMLQTTKNGFDICINSYSYQSDYTYTASSRIYRMNDEKFDSVFSARVESEYGWRQYYIDNEYTYQSAFEDEAYKVPMFLDDSASYDDEKYTVIYLSSNGDDNSFNTAVDDTVKTIESLNKNYVAEE